MKHFYKNIQGWFQASRLYSEMVEQAEDGATFVEVGAWKGRSTAYMATEIANSGKQISFHTVDWFKGSNEPAHHADPIVQNGKLYEHFCENIRPVRHLVNVLQMSSTEGAQMFADNSLDFVFLDGAHDYDSVVADILAWYPKLKPGGVLAGDDFMMPPFPGVTKAVRKALPQARMPYWPIWTCRVPLYLVVYDEEVVELSLNEYCDSDEKVFIKS